MHDIIAGANLLRKNTAGVQAKAAVAGTIMETGPAGTGDAGNVDEDVFNIGRLNAGNAVDLAFRLPPNSTLVPKVTLLAANGTPVTNSDTNLINGHFHGTVTNGGDYYAKVEALSGAGANGQYVLDVVIDDAVAPRVVAVSRLPASGAGTSMKA